MTPLPPTRPQSEKAAAQVSIVIPAYDHAAFLDIVGYLGADDVLRPGCVRAAVETLAALPYIMLTY